MRVRARGPVLLALLATLPAEAAPRATRVEMPFSCVLAQGRPVLTPSHTQSYEIASARAERRIMACGGAERRRCRPVVLHRLQIACSGGKVPWSAIASTIARLPGSPLSLTGSRIALRSGTAVLRSTEVPAGFAPLLEVGARLVHVPVPPRSPDGRGAPDSAVSSGTSEASGIAQMATSVPAVLVRHAQALDAPAETNAAWVTLVEAAPAHDTTRLSWLIIAAVLMSGALLAASGRHIALRYGLAPPMLRSPRTMVRFAAAGLEGDGRACAELSALATTLAEEIARSTRSLSGAPSLRRIVLRETRAIERRHAVILASRTSTGEDLRRTRQRLTQVVQDLGRLKEIAESASKSLSPDAPRLGPALPQDVSEAFEVLGANADVDERVLKKLVDALRASWHPDLARDETARREREERIKQINAAWDLISGRRRET